MFINEIIREVSLNSHAALLDRNLIAAFRALNNP
jgi:hypothetical protein